MKARAAGFCCLMLVLAATGACRESAPPPPAISPPDVESPEKALKRREQLRDELRRTLGPDYATPLPEADAEALARGGELYAQLCRGCHGTTGRGDGPVAPRLAVRTPDLTDARTLGFYSQAGRLQIIRQGAAGTPMIGWGTVLDEGDLRSVYFFTRSLSQPP